MTKIEIEEAVKQIQGQIAIRASLIPYLQDKVDEFLHYAKESVNSVNEWRAYHHYKEYRNKAVKQQILDKKMLKHFYSLQNMDKVVVNIASVI